MSRMTKTAALDALVRAMDEQRPGCRGDDRFTIDADRVTLEQTAAMDAICARCPILQQCRAYAQAAKPTGGRWAGAYYPVSRRTKQAAA